MIHLAVVDDHLLFRKSFCFTLSAFQNVKVIFDGADGEELLHALKSKKIDVVLLDVQMPNMNGFTTCKLLRELHPHILILIISQFSDGGTIYQMIQLGAHGFISKNADPTELKTAITKINQDGFYFGAELGLVIEQALSYNQAKNYKIEPDSELTQKELQIIKWAGKGLTIKEIADKLYITPRAVEAQRHKMLLKTDAKNFLGCVLFALKTNQLSLQEMEVNSG
jgi:DNA-binding NarL/FixJ family response regulator